MIVLPVEAGGTTGCRKKGHVFADLTVRGGRDSLERLLRYAGIFGVIREIWRVRFTPALQRATTWLQDH